MKTFFSTFLVTSFLLFVNCNAIAGKIVVNENGEEVDTTLFNKTGKMEDLEKMPSYERVHGLSLLLAGHVQSDKRQQIIDK